MSVRDDICGECGLPFEEGEKRYGVCGRSGYSHESAHICVERLQRKVLDVVRSFEDAIGGPVMHLNGAFYDSTGSNVVALNHDEALRVGSIVRCHILENGSIYGNYDKISDENKLRAKFGIVLIEGEKGKPLPESTLVPDVASTGLEALFGGATQKPPCKCHPMVEGTNPNCPRHGLLCDLQPPQGYANCTRSRGHEGPCALDFAKGGPSWD